jgi:4-hydroxy-tetrahydrodipicolinate reductase
VTYESEVDSMTLVHNAKSREAFASGALMAAEFMHQRQGIYGMKDLLGF